MVAGLVLLLVPAMLWVPVMEHQALVGLAPAAVAAAACSVVVRALVQLPLHVLQLLIL
jgi:hypothetical protein